MDKSTCSYDPDDKIYYFECPYCKIMASVHINDINCKIFRHGCYINEFEIINGVRYHKNINPHASKEVCDKLVIENKIYGCGKPFRFIVAEPSYVIKCDYI